ncbi:MAG: hypothetical protein IKP55_05935, partial [Clostridia bacterium]|nr:hypothetical protein [Clostridia bacterium]
GCVQFVPAEHLLQNRSKLFVLTEISAFCGFFFADHVAFIFEKNPFKMNEMPTPDQKNARDPTQANAEKERTWKPSNEISF